MAVQTGSPRSHLWDRECYNPLRGLNIARCVTLLEQYQRGEMADPQWVYHFIEQSDPDLFAILTRREAALLQLDWEVRIASGAGQPAPFDKALAREQAAVLRETYEGIDNLYEAIAHLQLATFRGFAHCEKVRDARGAIFHLELVDQWHLVRDGLRGRWKYNPQALSTSFDGLSDDDFLDPADFLIRERDRHVNRIALLKFIRANLSEKDWDAFIVIYGVPSGVIVGPPGISPEQETAYQSAAQTITEGGSGYLPHGSDYRPNDLPRGTDPFRPRLDYLTEKLVLAGTGGLLTMLAQSGSGTLAGSPHQEAFESIARSEARQISEIFQRQLDREVLTRHFPKRPALAYFELAAHEPLDPGAVAEQARKFAAAGYRMERRQLEELSGYRLTEIGSSRRDEGVARIENRDRIPTDEIDHWVTINGHHVPIRKNQSRVNEKAGKPWDWRKNQPMMRATPTFGGELAAGHYREAFGIGHEAVRRLFSGLIGPTDKERSEQTKEFGKDPDGSPRYEYKPLGDRMAREQGLFTPFLKFQHFEPSPGDSTATASGKAVFNAVSDFAGSVESPLGLAMFGADGVAARIAAGAFSFDQLAGIKDQVEAALKADTTQGKIQGILGALLALGFGILGAKHALSRHGSAGPSEKGSGEAGETEAKPAPVAEAKEPVAPADAPESRPPASSLLKSKLSRDITRYLDAIERHTGVRLHPKQRQILADNLRQNAYKRLSSKAGKKHRSAFTDKSRAVEIAKWEQETGQVWPRYTQDVLNRTGTVDRHAGDPYDAHHVIENIYGGPHQWWNLTPARFPNEHQAGIHLEAIRKSLFP